ncbi:heterokaryon incompatibility domain-containing protein [Trichoderma evansii]
MAMSAQNPSIVDGPESLYRQLPLSGLEIRLLRLEPSGGPSAEIRASLIKYNMEEIKNENPSFQALSYTWGNNSAARNIIINGIKLPVADNLYSFLQHRCEASQCIDLWVDAICINQNDLLEKNHQIPMMSMIYATASSLVIWLGPSSFDSGLAIQSIFSLGCGSPYDKIATIPHNEWQAIQSLLERPWWKRIWIIQELTMGAMGTKLDKAQIYCGQARVPWTNLVVAAARMKANQDDQRQAFPAITDILELDSLRDTAGHFLLRSTPEALFDLLCRYRHCQASNKRDKIYAIWNMFITKPSNRLEARYDESVEKVYTDFAAALLSGESKLEILRQCSNGDPDLPSWAPDWSTTLGSLPLPLRKIQRYFDVPWWAEPQYTKPKTTIGANGICQPSPVIFRCNGPPITSEHEMLLKRRIKQLEMAVKGAAVIKDLDDVPKNFAFHQIPGLKDLFPELLHREDFMLVVGHENPHLPDKPDALQQGELITERNMKRWLLQELKHSNSKPLYETATSVDASFKVDKNEKTLEIKGILWDELEICHESFVEDVDRNWTDATRFMVAIGHCKHLATSNKKASIMYPTINQLLEAFWSTLFVGQSTGKLESRYEDWLPEISKSWSPGQPPMSAKTAGLVELAEMCEAFDQSLSTIVTGTEDCPSTFISELDPQLKERAFPQHDDDYIALLCQLASTWQEQPYDLYHRPFNLANIVPDPYWECRRHSDELAKQQAKKRRVRHITSDVDDPEDAEDADHSDRKLVYQAIDDSNKALRQQPSLVPQDTLEAGIEKFALGRRFFITKKGYFGLGPQKLEPEDRIAVLFGSGVPFVLRKCPTIRGKRAWRIIGECYVQGIMQGKVIRKWELGTCEAQMLLLI